MALKISKRIINNYQHEEYGVFDTCIAYAIYDGQNIVGTFLLADDCGFIDFDDTRLIITIRHNLIEDDEYKILDRKTRAVIGEFLIPEDIGGYKLVGSLKLGKTEYIFKKQKPAIRSKLLKRNTWGHYRFELSNSIFKAIYQFQVGVNFFEIQGTQLKNFDAEIEIQGNLDLLAIFCGLFLVEQALEVEDNKRT